MRTNPVAAFMAVIVAPGTAMPWGSITRPVIVPVVCCANEGRAASVTAMASSRTTFSSSSEGVGAAPESEDRGNPVPFLIGKARPYRQGPDLHSPQMS